MGARVPGIVRGPDVKAGQVSGAVADLTDVVVARARFDEILHSLPIPTPREGVAIGGRVEKKAERKAKKGKPAKR